MSGWTSDRARDRDRAARKGRDGPRARSVGAVRQFGVTASMHAAVNIGIGAFDVDPECVSASGDSALLPGETQPLPVHILPEATE
ncbi:hypothetical protein H696_05676 [Fonticula alba]|uniref:Uncharacterized protein n=1 Tax=Fonticula alba TaxID=691883 RepID=A0A058Z1F7_FONAL|nr:hypothetical protein H696_05676 [Fonticula alba]KCV67951.1 hypothetical protein H696_05676 [Fonticula alba]|eukprot:XP_009497771.1 hypothetical protein H696_05676 [Fonticula alba]